VSRKDDLSWIKGEGALRTTSDDDKLQSDHESSKDIC
jgi:hypothetical protein